EGLLRFRHDRVQQAAYGPLSQARREELHLAIARRLARQPEFAPLAADQYLPAAASMREPAERRAAARLLHDAAAVRFGLTNYAAAERFLAGAIALLGEAQTPADRKLLALLATGQHAALYSMGRLDEADRLYRSIEHHCATPVDLVEAACVQVSSLTNRGRPRDALALGLGLLRKLGIVVPAADAMSAEVSRELDAFYQWVSDATRAGADRRAPATDASIVAVAALINRLMPAARLCDPTVVAWLVLESQRLWAAHGPCSKLAACLGHATLVTIATRDDYRSGYQAVGHVLATCEALGWLPEAAQVRDLFALSTSHWFEPLERSVALVREAREGLLRQGDLQGTCFADYISITALLDCAPNLDLYAGEIEAALAFARRTGNAHGTDLYLVHRQLLRLLRGRTMAPGSLSDGDFDELQREQRLGANPSADATFHLVRTVAAVLTGDMAALVREAQALVALRSYLQSFYATALLHLLHAMAQAQRLKDAAPHARPALLAELNASCQWL
ncbi:MAG TPA: ATPase, partial [Ramlibacter sp.]|nr:ATPase [Ramlibacter sp.]